MPGRIRAGGAALARVVVSGYYGFGNAGDELILAALLRALAGHEVTVLSRDPASTAAEHGVHAQPRTAPAAVCRTLARCDLLVSGGGGLLQDATGPGSVPYYLGVILLARALGKPAMVYAQGIGPLHAGWTRRALRLLAGAAAITVRDAESAELLRAAGVSVRVEVTADAALALPVPPRGTADVPELRALGVSPGERLLAVAPRPYGGPEFAATLGAAAGALAERLRCRVVLVPMQLPEDLSACEHIAAAMQVAPVIMRRHPAPERYPHVFAAFDLVVGMRLHSLILAALARATPVGLSYDPKIDAFLDALGIAPHGLPLDAPRERIVEVALTARQAAGESDLAARLTGLQAAAARNNAVLEQVLATLR